MANSTMMIKAEEPGIMTSGDQLELSSLYARNTPGAFWRLLLEPEASAAEWAEACRAAASIMPSHYRPQGDEAAGILPAALAERIFGPQRWQLSWTKLLYYRVKPLAPRRLAIQARRLYRSHQENSFPLDWPIEDRLVRFLYRCVDELLRRRGLATAPYIQFWPNGHRFALALTHDVESKQGLALIQTVAALEENLGFRSLFNFVPERYYVEPDLLHDLRSRGFEVGIHGLTHDGRDFLSKCVFDNRARKINVYAHQWGTEGFRAPYTHRHPQWMQELHIAYDLSFFDTDPYESMPGGTMSIWPFFIGHFVELPYTLAQDHTLMVILRQHTPQPWLEKVNFIEQQQGLALVNVHPDYMYSSQNLAVYEAFLQRMAERQNCWHDLPGAMARWWRRRAACSASLHNGLWTASDLPGASIGAFHRDYSAAAAMCRV